MNKAKPKQKIRDVEKILGYRDFKNFNKNYKGLLNLTQNVCFANAVLQCLARLTDFRASLKQISRSNRVAGLLNKVLIKLTEGYSDEIELDYQKTKLFQEIKKKSGGVKILLWFKNVKNFFHVD